MIRKTDKYLLLFLLMIGFLRLTLNAECLTPGKLVYGKWYMVDSLPPTANHQPSSVNSQPSTVNRHLLNDTLPFLKPDTLPSGIIIVPPSQGQLYIVGNIFIKGNRVTK